jgi:hypothetical protein
VPRQLPLVVRQAIIRRDDAVRRRIVELSRSRRARAPPLLLRQCVGTAQRWSWIGSPVGGPHSLGEIRGAAAVNVLSRLFAFAAHGGALG